MFPFYRALPLHDPLAVALSRSLWLLVNTHNNCAIKCTVHLIAKDQYPEQTCSLASTYACANLQTNTCVCRSWTLHEVRQGAKRLFQKYDRDGDAKLDVEEIKGMLLGLGKEISIHDIKKYISMGRGFGLHKNTKKKDSILDVPSNEPKKKGAEHKHVQRTDSGGAANSPEDKKSPRDRASHVTADADALEHTPDSARSGGRIEAGKESEGVGGVVGRMSVQSCTNF